jgi:glycosyltransferase involved in cell wall biosynthesis
MAKNLCAAVWTCSRVISRLAARKTNIAPLGIAANQLMTNQLSVIIPCKNERAHLAGCIASVRSLATEAGASEDLAIEIVVADSGSTDDSLAIARSLGCRVIERDYRTYGDFVNWAIPQASHPWVLVLDSDERITPSLAAEIRGVLKSPRQDGYSILRRNYFLGHPLRFGPWHSDRCLRLFRRDLGRYEGPSDHGKVKVSSGRVGALAAPMDHYTISSWDQWLRKMDRYATVQAAEWHAAGRRPSYLHLLLNPPLRFFRDYVVRLGFMDGAIGLQISWTSGFYSFMKQARLWELHHAQVHGETSAAEAVKESLSPALQARSRDRSVAA